MKLTVLRSIESHDITARLGISKERADELMSILTEESLKLSDQGEKGDIPLTDYYASIAEKCNTLEEYTACLHCFHFWINDIGALANDPMFNNETGK